MKCCNNMGKQNSKKIGKTRNDVRDFFMWFSPHLLHGPHTWRKKLVMIKNVTNTNKLMQRKTPSWTNAKKNSLFYTCHLPLSCL